MAKIFISFIHEEAEVAAALQRLIRAKLTGDDVFVASEWQIYAGEDWLRKITVELREAKVVVLLLSPCSVRRPWVNFEAGGAWFAEKVLIPVCHAGLTPDRLPKPYSSLQSLVIPADIEYLITSIHRHLRPAPMHLPLMPFPLDDPEVADFESVLERFCSAYQCGEEGSGSS
jgi:TIR domain